MRQIEGRTGKTVEQFCAERAKRVRDAIELKVPDRVPFSVLIEPHAYSGIPNSACYDPVTLNRTMRQIAVDLAGIVERNETGDSTIFSAMQGMRITLSSSLQGGMGNPL